MSKLSRLRDLPLLWKLLVPFLAIIVVLGVTGGFFIVRNLAVQSQFALDQELTGRSLDARASVRDREIYLIESANLASNLEGMASSVSRGEEPATARLLQSVLALKTDLDLVVAAGAEGRGVAEFTRTPDGQIQRECCREWGSYSFVAQALQDPGGGKVPGFVESEQGTMFAVAAPVCSGGEECAQVGATIVGIDLETIAAEALGRSTHSGGESGVTIYGAEGTVLTQTGLAAVAQEPPGSEEDPLRVSGKVSDTGVTTLYTSFRAGGHRLGTMAVSAPTAPAFAAARGAAFRLALTLLLVMGGVIAIGGLLSRFIVGQVRSLLRTQRMLGRGELSARAQVDSQDEVGELASGLNEMAEQLEAMYDTLELKVAQRTEEIERLLEERTEFFAAVSHELRTPLAVVLRNSEMLLDPAYRRNGRLPSEPVEALKESGAQLKTLINDILDLAKAEAGGVEVELSEVSLIEVLRQLRGTVKALAASGGIRYKVEIPRKLPHVLADRIRLRQMIMNLVDNAVKYTPEGGSLEVTAALRQGMVEVSVADSGPGIPPEAEEYIFEAFYRARGARAQHGQLASGLGLAIVKRLVEAHGGDISYSSEPGAGTTFTFTLQLASSGSSAGSRRSPARGRDRAPA